MVEKVPVSFAADMLVLCCNCWNGRSKTLRARLLARQQTINNITGRSYSRRSLRLSANAENGISAKYAAFAGNEKA